MAAKTPAGKTGPRYPKEEISRRGNALYEANVKPLLKTRDNGKYVAIDIESGEYELHRDVMTATDRLWKRLGDPQPFLIRVGHSAAGKTGYRKVVES